MTVLDFITLTRRGWKILALMTVLGVLAGFAYGYFAPKVYESRATGFITTTGSSVVAGSDEATARASSYVPLITSKPVREAIAKESGVELADLHGGLSARVVPGSTLLEVTATASDPESALNLANGALHGLAVVIDDIEAKAGADGTSITVVPLDNAVAPTSPSAPNKEQALALGALAGLVLGFVFLFLRRALDVRVRLHTDMNELMGTGVLGRVPKMGRNETPDDDTQAGAIASESFRQIRTGLRFSSVDAQVRVVMITSASQGEGKSTVAAYLARVLAESGQRTLLVDADLRRPKVARNFGIDGAVGLSEVLSGQVPAPSTIQPTDEPNLFVLPAGGTPPNPSEMLGSVALENLLSELRRDFFIVIDAPPVLPVTDASVVSVVVDGVVFVVATGKTRKAEVTAARTQLEQVRARVLGVVFNLVSLKGGDSGYGYGYGYYRQNKSYYLAPKKAKKSKKAAAPVPRPSAPAQPSPVVAPPVGTRSSRRSSRS